MKCCCGKYQIDMHFENASVSKTRVQFNDIVHEVADFRKDAFCGPQHAHDLRDAQDTIQSLEARIEALERKRGGDLERITYLEGHEYSARLRAEASEAREKKLAEALEHMSDTDNEPEYHQVGMGCGLEDRCITDRYDAMEHGWDCAMERVYAEVISVANEAITENKAR